MIGSFASVYTAFLVAKMKLKNYSTNVDKTSPVDRFWCLRCLNMIGLFVSGATNSIVPKLELKILPHLAQSIGSEIIDGF